MICFLHLDAQSPSLLPLILYLLRLTPSPSLKGTLLQSLPSLAAHKYSATPTANVLRTLAGHPSLLPVSLRLLGKLWSRHDSVFPLVASLLALQKAPATVATELDIAKAVVIKEICCTRYRDTVTMFFVQLIHPLPYIRFPSTITPIYLHSWHHTSIHSPNCVCIFSYPPKLATHALPLINAPEIILCIHLLI